MSAAPLPSVQPCSLREAIARIIDPHAFDDARWPNGFGAGIRERLQATALAKADQVIALDVAFEELPEDLQQAAELLDSVFGPATGKDALVASLAAFAPIPAEDGRSVFTALVKPLEGGALLVSVLVDEGDDVHEGKPVWVVETLDDPKARALSAHLDVVGAGGGTA